MGTTQNRAVTVDGGTIYSMPRVVAMMLCAAGMALQWAFLHAVTFSQTIMGDLPQSAGQASWVANMIVTVSVFLALLPVSKRRGFVSEDRLLIRLMGGCICAGVATMSCAAFALRWAPLAVVASALIAAGTAALIIMWGELYRFLNPKGEQVAITLSAIVASVALYQLLTACPPLVRVALFALLPLGSIACLIRSRDLLHELSPTWERRAAAPDGQKSPTLFYVYIAVLSIPYNYLQMTGGLDIVSDERAWGGVLAVTVFIMIGVALAEIAAEKRGLLLVPPAVLFLLSAAMLAHVVTSHNAPVFASYLLYSGYYLFLAMVYLALGPLATADGADPTRLFCTAMIANVLGLLAGSALGGLAPLLGEGVTSAFVLVVVYAILFVGFKILNGGSYGIFRVNRLDLEDYSFDFVATIPTGEAAPAPDLDFADMVERRCESIAREASLSARELEVLRELARGKTLSTIAHDQTVSENTIKAHTKSIYRKLGVHSREELLGHVGGSGSTAASR